MGFIGSTSYYILCVTALIILIILLISLQLKPKTSTKKTALKLQQSSTEYIPKYAAGDDMDRINRKAYALWSEKKFSLKEIPMFIIGLLLTIAILAPQYKHNVETPQTPISPPTVQPTTPMTIPAPPVN